MPHQARPRRCCRRVQVPDPIDAGPRWHALKQGTLEGAKVGTLLDGSLNEANQIVGHFHDRIGLVGRGGNRNNHATASMLVRFGNAVTPFSNASRGLIRHHIMHRQPDDRFVRRRPLDSILPMRRDVHEIAGHHLDRLHDALEAESRFTVQHPDPLVLILIEPEAVGRCVAVGDDPFDPHVGGVVLSLSGR